jgi:hypothetical protein
MTERYQQSLEMRREELVERSRSQRAALMAGILPVAEKLATVDRAVASVKRYPVVSAAIAGAVVLFGSRKLFDWAARGITLYTLLKKM